MKKFMVAKKKGAMKPSKRRRIKTLNLKRESIKDLSGREKKKIKGGGGASGGVLGDRKLMDT